MSISRNRMHKAVIVRDNKIIKEIYPKEVKNLRDQGRLNLDELYCPGYSEGCRVLVQPYGDKGFHARRESTERGKQKHMEDCDFYQQYIQDAKKQLREVGNGHIKLGVKPIDEFEKRSSPGNESNVDSSMENTAPSIIVSTTTKKNNQKHRKLTFKTAKSLINVLKGEDRMFQENTKNLLRDSEYYYSENDYINLFTHPKQPIFVSGFIGFNELNCIDRDFPCVHMYAKPFKIDDSAPHIMLTKDDYPDNFKEILRPLLKWIENHVEKVKAGDKEVSKKRFRRAFVLGNIKRIDNKKRVVMDVKSIALWKM